MWIRFLFSTFTNCIPNKSGVILCHTIKYEHYKHLLVYLIVKHVFSAVSSVKTLPYRKLLKRYYDLHVYLHLFWFIKSPFFFTFCSPSFDIPVFDQQTTTKKVNIVCHFCSEPGHKALNCPKMKTSDSDKIVSSRCGYLRYKFFCF